MRDPSMGETQWRAGGLGTALVALLLVVGPAAASAGSCDRTTELMARSCARNAEADQFVALGNCANIGDTGGATRCVERAERDFRAAQAECGAQGHVRAKV